VRSLNTFLRKIAGTVSVSEREEADNYLTSLRGLESRVMEDARETLENMNDNDMIDLTDDQINEVAAERASFSAAQFIVHNPVGQGGLSFFQDVMAKASHPNGPSWSIPANKDLRRYDGAIIVLQIQEWIQQLHVVLGLVVLLLEMPQLDD
jgi:hypothetical protein